MSDLSAPKPITTPGLKQIDSFLAKIELFLIVVFLFSVLGLTFLQMVLRYVGHALTWSDVAARHVNLSLACAAAMLATRERRHLQMDLLTRLIPEKAKPFLELIISVACIIIASLLYIATYKYVVLIKNNHFTLFGDVEQWYFVLMMPIGFGIVAVHCVIHFMDLIYRMTSKKPT